MKKNMPYILLLIAPLALIFSLSGIQTIEWRVINNEPIPPMAFIFLFFVILWGRLVAGCKEKNFHQAMTKLDKWLENYLK